MRTAGVDVGSLTGKALILEDNRILAWGVVPTGPDSAETAREAMDMALQKAGLGMGQIEYVVSTGYGRVVVPFAQRNVTEISCHAKGANWFFPSVRTILDMGGQDCKAIRCDQTGKVVNFAMNDKCAAGAGRSMEVMADLLNVPLADIGQRSLHIVKGEVPVSSTCVVFAKSEVLANVRQGVPVNDVLAGICTALATRVYGLLRRVGVAPDFAISGGIAKNIGVVSRVEQKVGLKANICFEPQIVGALGAAIFAREIAAKQQKKPATV
ncbi:MAG: benzoyl-CoA reductase, bzd-type, subunit Q [Chloroflexi bacterium]|nr:benzoyl-CoA reductase, bzd-type, subunit Q [Chloroflexota bacterium]